MQIQQQLLMQNQALTQLLQQSGPVSGQTASSSTPMPSMIFNQSVASAGLNQSSSSYTLPARVSGNVTQTETVTTVFESSRKLSHDQERKLQEQLLTKFGSLGSHAKPLSDKQMSRAFRHFEKKNEGQRLPLTEIQVQEQYFYFISRMPQDDLTSYNDKELMEQFQGHLRQVTANNYSGSFDSLTENELKAQYR